MAYEPNPRLDQVYILAAIWAETLVYGFYVCLFILGMHVLTKPSPTANSPRERTSVSSKIFFGALWLMFLNASFHISWSCSNSPTPYPDSECSVVQMYRLIRGYGFILSSDGTPIGYISQVPLQWDGIINPILIGMQIWFGDALAIYRCYIIWGHNLWVVAVPILLALAAMGVNLTLYSWFPKPWTSYHNMVPVINAGYPLAFTQNVLTTGLIAWKIWKQHRMSKKSGLKAAHRVSLLQVIRIIVESAMIYTFQVLSLVILYFLGHPLQFVFQSLTVPTTGEL
ncbi:hypothetical protein NMY22_g5805 [Coprinellus aureogranulatus]|nr:hypothetical protein NMY22_g5805 [Coprinellus aureogranulatus]